MTNGKAVHSVSRFGLAELRNGASRWLPVSLPAPPKPSLRELLESSLTRHVGEALSMAQFRAILIHDYPEEKERFNAKAVRQVVRRLYLKGKLCQPKYAHYQVFEAVYDEPPDPHYNEKIQAIHDFATARRANPRAPYFAGDGI